MAGRKGLWIGESIILDNFEMKMDAARDAALSHASNNFAFTDVLTWLDFVVRK